MQEDWLARWRDGRIGFHEGRPNALLVRHVARLAGRRRVLVPLCGKAEDLAFLAARGHDVIGIELAESAVRAFFDEHALTPRIAPHGPFVAWSADAPQASPAGERGTLTLLVGDFFAATRALIGSIDAVYDRAALIALPRELRPAYVERLRGVVPAGAAAIVITLEYDQAVMTGPPFAVLEAELRGLYAGAEVTLVDERPATGGGKCAQSGVSAIERCFAIQL